MHSFKRSLCYVCHILNFIFSCLDMYSDVDCGSNPWYHSSFRFGFVRCEWKIELTALILQVWNQKPLLLLLPTNTLTKYLALKSLLDKTTPLKFQYGGLIFIVIFDTIPYLFRASHYHPENLCGENGAFVRFTRTRREI